MIIKFKTKKGQFKEFMSNDLIRYKVFCGETYSIKDIKQMLTQTELSKEKMGSLQTEVGVKGEGLGQFLSEGSKL